MTLWLRKALVQVGTVEIASEVTSAGPSGLDLTFDVQRSLSRKPNTATLQIYNLNQTDRARIHEQRHYPVKISCGYGEGANTLIFSGDLRKATTSREGPDLITEIEAGDGERLASTARARVSFGRNASVRDVAIALVRACGGTDALVPNSLRSLSTGQSTYPGGVAVTGLAAVELGRFAESCGYELSFQDGVPQLLSRGRALARSAILLSYDTGLISAPARDSRGKVSARCLIIPDLVPGRQVDFDASVTRGLGNGLTGEGGGVSGQMRVESIKYSGSTFGADWYADIVCGEL